MFLVVRTYTHYKSTNRNIKNLLSRFDFPLTGDLILGLERLYFLQMMRGKKPHQYLDSNKKKDLLEANPYPALDTIFCLTPTKVLRQVLAMVGRIHFTPDTGLGEIVIYYQE